MSIISIFILIVIGFIINFFIWQRKEKFKNDEMEYRVFLNSKEFREANNNYNTSNKITSFLPTEILDEAFNKFKERRKLL